MTASPCHRYRLLETPTGLFAICAMADGGLRTRWVEDRGDAHLAGAIETPTLEPDLAEGLLHYFGGADVGFGGVRIPGDAASFSGRCWTACRSIPRGETRSYAELAAMAGRGPGAARAAGQAMRRNPLPIVVPCHRVLAARGGLGGFAGSDDPDGRTLAVKRWLLALEGALPPRVPARGDTGQARFAFV